MLRTLVDNLAPGAATFRVQCETRDFGDNSWVIVMDGPKLGSQALSGFYGRVRNGNAIVDVKGEGTHSPEWMMTHLDHVLAAVDDSTAAFGEDDDWR